MSEALEAVRRETLKDLGCIGWFDPQRPSCLHTTMLTTFERRVREDERAAVEAVLEAAHEWRASGCNGEGRGHFHKRPHTGQSRQRQLPARACAATSAAARIDCSAAEA